MDVSSVRMEIEPFDSETERFKKNKFLFTVAADK